MKEKHTYALNALVSPRGRLVGLRPRAHAALSAARASPATLPAPCRAQRRDRARGPRGGTHGARTLPDVGTGAPKPRAGVGGYEDQQSLPRGWGRALSGAAGDVPPGTRGRRA